MYSYHFSPLVSIPMVKKKIKSFHLFLSNKIIVPHMQHFPAPSFKPQNINLPYHIFFSPYPTKNRQTTI